MVSGSKMKFTRNPRTDLQLCRNEKSCELCGCQVIQLDELVWYRHLEELYFERFSDDKLNSSTAGEKFRAEAASFFRHRSLQLKCSFRSSGLQVGTSFSLRCTLSSSLTPRMRRPDQSQYDPFRQLGVLPLYSLAPSFSVFQGVRDPLMVNLRGFAGFASTGFELWRKIIPQKRLRATLLDYSNYLHHIRTLWAINSLFVSLQINRMSLGQLWWNQLKILRTNQKHLNFRNKKQQKRSDTHTHTRQIGLQIPLIN